jgi:hypothetical protein
MTDNNSSESELQVCARVLRALAHRIRGDLSVITNDLAYIATVVDPAEVERARSRCSRISTALAHIGTLSGLEARAEDNPLMPLSQVLALFGLRVEVPEQLARSKVSVSDALLHNLAHLIRGLLGDWEGCLVDQDQIARDSISLLIRFSKSVDFSERYSSLGSFAAERLGESSVVEAGLIDLILRDLRWSIAIESLNREVTLRLTIPLEQT